MIGLVHGDDGRICSEWIVDPWVGHQVRLKLVQIHVQRPVKPQGGRDRGDDLSNQPVEVGVGRPCDVQVGPHNIVDGLIVNEEGAVTMLESGVGVQDRVVRLHDGRGDLWCRVDGETQLRLLAIFHRQAFHEEGSKARPSPAPEGMKDEEALQAGAVVRHPPDPVHRDLNLLLADGVVAPGVVVSRVLLAGDQLLRMKELAVGPGSHLVHHGRLQIHEDGPRHVLTRVRLREEGVERVVALTNASVIRHLRQKIGKEKEGK